ncbi:MAG: beta-Ala-His dipeptidase [Defluviitaleaceae bacterium]|nr:beta-Ala-His dipeptidase [Defluviitaleaceae bacterium]
MTRVLENVNPKNVFKFFEDISAIPRPSKHEDEIADYLVNFAKERNLEVIKDEFKNVIIKKAASSGYENAPGVILQGHSDMVPEKNETTEHDFLKDGLKLYVDGEFLKAKGTTLGADNGIAVAYALAILDGNYNHPKLCVVITSDEEAGMSGARNLDLTLIEGYSNFINLDSSPEGVFTVSCAGGKTVTVKIPITHEPFKLEEYKIYEVSISGLVGGHSGVDIHKNLANANRLMGRLLNEIRRDCELIEISGGMKPNAIPRESKATIAVKGELKISKIDKIANIFKNEHIENEPNLTVSCKEIDYKYDDGGWYMENGFDIISTLMLLPYGVLRQTEAGTIASNNIGVVETINNNREVVITNAVRSSILSLRDFMQKQIEIVGGNAGGYVSASEGYPAWEYKQDNPLRDKALEVYKSFSGVEGLIELTHGGLECGIFASQMEGVNFIATGPNLYNLHTPDEQLNIPSTERVFDYLIKLLEELN